MQHRRYRSHRDDLQTKKRRRPSAIFPNRKLALAAAIPVALLVVYSAFVAPTPTEVPIPLGVKVPFPAATDFLVPIVQWCGDNPIAVIAIGVGLMLPGVFISRIANWYYPRLGIVTVLVLGFSYISIAAPIDRLINDVEQRLVEEQRPIPDHLPGGIHR